MEARLPEQGEPTSGVEINAALLRDWPLPQPHPQGDKEERGRLLLVGGSPQMPGAIILAATAALRAGAGKVQVATCAGVAQNVAGALLEGRVFAMPETKGGGIAPAAADSIIERAVEADSVLIGPGMVDEDSIAGLLGRLLPALAGVPLLLDAGAITVLSGLSNHTSPLGEGAIISPHAGEMASLLRRERGEIAGDTVRAAREAVEQYTVNVLLKGAETLLVTPGGMLYRHHGGNVGLATGGSGDALAGLIGALMARGAPPPQAAAWAVYVHARAGERLAQSVGPLGFLTREMLPIFPGLFAEIANQGTDDEL
ncbi:MAG: NAD(P)H-hydrate dehydratase [Blastocatellia bacterium]